MLMALSVDSIENEFSMPNPCFKGRFQGFQQFLGSGCLVTFLSHFGYPDNLLRDAPVAVRDVLIGLGKFGAFIWHDQNSPVNIC